MEKYEQHNLLNKLHKDIAKLLMAAILDNTLNFTAKITKQRDIDAYSKLEKITGEVDFKTTYFSECQKVIEEDLVSSIVNDIKIQKTNELLPNVLGQLTVWDITTILNKKSEIKEAMNRYGNEWIINIISLKENKSYILCSNETIKNNLSKLLNGNSEDDVLIVAPAKLRKEIIKSALDFE